MPYEPIYRASALSNDGKRRGRQLRNSIPYQFDRELFGAPGLAFVADILERIAATEGRQRALKPRDAELRRKTINVLLANLAVAALNRGNPRQYVAVSLNANDYANTGLSLTAVQLAFKSLQELGLAVGKIGRGKPEPAFGWRGVRSRLRANREMRKLMKAHGLEPEYVRNPPRDIIQITGATFPAPPEPPDVFASREQLERINALLADTDLALCQQAWDRIATDKKPGEDLTDAERRHRQHLGDMTAKRLYRVFTKRWDHGGRLYGGWWIGVPKAERRYIQIDQEPTVELDYGQLHPTMLFAMIGRQLDYDAYTVPGFSRELGKETFMRLLNRTPDRGGRYIRKEGEVPLPSGVSAAEYTELYKRHLAPVRHLLGQGTGLNLQRKDSELALAVLSELAGEQIVALPIHDSFIVKTKHAEALRAVMSGNFTKLHGHEAIVK